MAATPDELFAFLDKLGIAYRTIEHAPLFTVEQSQSLRGKIPGAHTKNLFLKDKKGSLFLVSVLDAELMRHEIINCHPLVNTMTISMSASDLLRFLEATGHDPRIEPVAPHAQAAAQGAS